MDHTAREKVFSFFTHDKTKRQSSCNKCGLTLCGLHVSNMKRHLKVKHPEILKALSDDTKKIDAKRRKITIETNEDEIISSLVNIATEGGGSFSLFDNKGFLNILTPIYKALEIPPITSLNIMDHVRAKELAIRKEIHASVRRKLVSLKIDVVTGLQQSILGVNLQFMNSTLTSTDVVVKTLGVIGVTEADTELCIQNKILQTIAKYGIEIDQIFSITTDNGKNMVKAIELLPDDATAECLNDEYNGEHFMELLGSMTFPDVQLVRCPAHTLQLCVHDVNRQSEFSQKVSSCRQMTTVLHCGKYSRTFIDNDKQIPALDVPTRWNSTYMMLVKLFELREFIATHVKVDFSIDWNWVGLYIETFKETYEATILLEQEHFSYSDFIILWMELKLKCQKRKNYFTAELLARLKFREVQLLQNETLLAAIYMDPRINLLLTEEQQVVAKQYLKKTAFRIFNLSEPAIKQETKEVIDVDEPQPVDDKSLLATFLDGIQVEPGTEGEVPEKLSETYMEIENFKRVCGRLPLNSDMKKFYHDLKFKAPQLGALVQVVLAAPASQATVERSFSALNVISNEKSTSMTPKSMKSLLVVKLNS